MRYLTLKYPQILISLIGNYDVCESAISKGINVDYVEFDLNAIFHPVAHEFYPIKSQSFLHKKTTNHKFDENKLFIGICNRIIKITNIIKPKKGLYLAIDGIAGCSKISQQRKRRFNSAKENPSLSEEFSTNHISVGTIFMDKLSKYIDIFIQKQLENGQWKDLQIIFSNEKVVGEGEHKLLGHMRENPQDSYIVVSPDADLIFLCMGLHNPNVYIFRENIFNDIIGNFFLLNINKLRECILHDMNLADMFKDKSIDDIKKLQDIIIEDFIAMCFFIGNDFLPIIPSINIMLDGIEYLINTYTIILKEKGPLTNKHKNYHSINPENLLIFLKELSTMEVNMIMKNMKHAKFPDLILRKYITKDELNLEGYKKVYYNSKFNNVNIEIIVHEYFKGMTFVLNYYLHKIPSFTWYYPFHYAPFFKELCIYINNFDFLFKFEESLPLSPFEQLLAILPPSNAFLLPEQLRWLSTNIDSPIIDFFPIDFEVDISGKNNEYEGVVCLPNINIDRLRSAFKDIENKLSKEDLEKNKPGEIIIYSLEEE